MSFVDPPHYKLHKHLTRNVSWSKTMAKSGLPRVKFEEMPACILLPDDINWKAARMGPWETHACDTARFERRVKLTEKAISWVFAPSHRDRAHAQHAQTPS